MKTNYAFVCLFLLFTACGGPNRAHQLPEPSRNVSTPAAHVVEPSRGLADPKANLSTEATLGAQTPVLVDREHKRRAPQTASVYATPKWAGTPTAPQLTEEKVENAVAPAEQPIPVAEVSTPQPVEDSAVDAYLGLPPRLSQLTAKESEFVASATVALRSAFVTDSDDPSVLISLQDKLAQDPALEKLQTPWFQPLSQGAKRAQTLQQIGSPLRSIKGAFSQAKEEPTTKLYLGINHAQCRSGFARVREIDAAAMNTIVNIETMMPQSLHNIETTCVRSHDAELATRIFPKPAGAPKLRNLVRRLYTKANKGAQIRKIVVEGTGWQTESDKKTLRAIVGVRRKNTFPEDPCTMETIVLQQGLQKRAQPSCCTVEQTLAIDCKQL